MLVLCLQWSWLVENIFCCPGLCCRAAAGRFLLHGWCLLSSIGHQSLQRSGKAPGRRAVLVPAVDFQAFSGSHCFKHFLAQGQAPAAPRSWLRSVIQHQAGGGAASGPLAKYHWGSSCAKGAGWTTHPKAFTQCWPQC